METGGTKVVLEDISEHAVVKDVPVNPPRPPRSGFDRHSKPLCLMLGLDTNQVLALPILYVELPFDMGFNTWVETSS